MRKRTIAVPLSVLAAAAGLAGGAFADSQSNSHPHKASGCGSERAVIGDAARRLHVTPTRLTDALKQAVIDQIDTAVAAGHLTRAQAKTIKQQIERSPGLAFGPGLFAPEIKAAQVIAPPAHRTIMAPGLLGRPAIVSSVARYLGLTDRQLMRRLRRGESLAQIAKARGKSESGLVRAITAAVKSQLKNVSKAKHIPRAWEQHVPLSTRHIQGIVSPSGPLGPPPPSGRVHVQVRAGGPAACFASAAARPAPLSLLRTSIGPPKP
ncbi:MAG TPA: hypothetical protein VGL78_13980 [Solirubrobacteraceae bacterium]